MDRTALVVLHTDDHEVLLQYRSKDALEYPHCWDFSAGGPIEFDETDLAGAERELFEKLGIKTELKEISREKVVYEDDEEEEIIMFAGSYDRQPMTYHYSVESARAFPKHEIKKMLQTPEMFYPQCHQFLKKLVG